MSSLKIAIVGAGGVGGYLAAKLSQNNYDVTLICKDKHYEAIKQNGLKVLEYKDEDFVVYPRVEKTVDDDIFDVVFLAVKSYDLQSACKTIEYCIDENTIVIPLSNGVEHQTTIGSYLNNGIICEGAIYIISHLERYGVINRESYTFYLLFGSKQENINLKILEQIFNSCDLKTTNSHNIQYDCWKKYLFICAMGSLTSYFKEPMGYIVKEQLELFIDILIEIKRVADEKGINISNNDIQNAVKQATHVPYDSKTSMQLDFEKGSQTEVESLTGYIVKEAEKLNIEVPQMKKIYDKLLSDI